MHFTLRTARTFHRAALIARHAMVGALLACGSSVDPYVPPPLPVVPALEPISFALLGPGKVAFDRIGGIGTTTGYGATYVIDGNAMSSAHVFDNVAPWGPALSPDGRRLAFTKFTGATTRDDVYIANIDGTGVQQVTRFLRVEGPPTWTPDGANVVFVANINSPTTYDVYAQSLAANAGLAQQLTNFGVRPDEPIVCPHISFDDVRVSISVAGALTYACIPGEIDVVSSAGNVSAYVASRANQRRWPIVFSPSWSPDGSRLAFIEIATDSATNYSIVGLSVKIMNADATNVTTIATLPATTSYMAVGGWLGYNNNSLCWMPDGLRLVFSVPEENLIAHLWVVRTDGTGLAQLTSAAGVWDRSVSCSR